MSNIILTSKYRDVIMEMSIEEDGAFLKYLSACAFDGNAVESHIDPIGWPMAWAIFMIAKNDLEPEDEDNE